MSYREALEVAVAAAREAGARLRAEMSRPGGPRRESDTKAPIDLEMERLLRERLLALDPSWGWEAEEDPSQRREAERMWIVDPNDGTRSFLRGQRGSSVSIALLDGGAPVVAVVYAYAAPDDDGDLFAWAEGEGPPTRNGVAFGTLVQRMSFAPGDAVLVSPAAERAAEANAKLVAPARFLPCPSSAWRLARTAAGDAIAASSYATPRRHDYAAGVALLRAVGGEAFDEHGEPVDLTKPGVQRLVAGVPGLARELGAREPRALGPSHELAPLVEPRPDRRVKDAARLGRAQGCWLAQLAGDSLGSLVEFQSPAAIRRTHPDGVRDLADGGTFHTIAGQPTDDSEMALAMARSVLEEGGYDPRAVLGAYVRWYDSRPFDIGNTVGTALRAAQAAERQGEDPLEAVARAASMQSQANGALMRLAPLGIVGAGLDPDVLARYAAADAGLTHPHPACRDANVVFALTLAHAIDLGPSPEAVYAFACGLAEDMDAHEVVRGALADASEGPPEDFLHQMGWLRLALQNAFHQLLHAESLEEGLIDTVGRGGDTDTNAAIAGALLGAVHGRAAVPWRWQRAVLACRPLEGLEGVRRARPRWLWPVDALVLAESLLLG